MPILRIASDALIVFLIVYWLRRFATGAVSLRSADGRLNPGVVVICISLAGTAFGLAWELVDAITG